MNENDMDEAKSLLDFFAAAFAMLSVMCFLLAIMLKKYRRPHRREDAWDDDDYAHMTME